MNKNKICAFTLMLVIFSAAFTACDKIKSLTANTNKTPELIDPIKQFPAEIQAFALPNVGRFKQHSAKKLVDVSGEYIGDAELYSIEYRYADDRYKDFYKSSFNGYDLELTVFKTNSAENPKNFMQKMEAENKLKDRKMKQCSPGYEYEDGHETTGAMPSRIVKRLKHPNGGELIIVEPGLFITGNCVSKDNRSPEIHGYWTDGIYLISAQPKFHYKAELGTIEGMPMLEDFVADYIAAVGKTAK